MMKSVLIAVVSAVQAYLLGSIDTGILVSKFLYHDDVRKYGSGAAGMTNMLRTFGKKAAALTAVGDVLKGVVAVCLGRWLFSHLPADAAISPYLGVYLAAILAVVGHSKPIYFGFKGGKGVLVGAVMLAFFDWRVFGIAFVLFLLSVIVTKWISLGSILGAVSFPITTWVFYRDPVLTAMALGMAAVVVFMHRSNIGRIIRGKENKFSFKSKKTMSD